MGSDAPADATDSKVARLIEVYDLGEIGREMEAAWLGEGSDRSSLRDLADKFNQALLLAAVSDAEMNIVSGEDENLYRLLTAEEASAGERVEAVTRLEQHGVDVEQLQSDFVSYQAIRHYLTDVRGVKYDDASQAVTVEKEQTTIDRLQARLETVVRDSLDRLQTAGAISLGDYRLFVSIEVLCQDCGRQYGIAALLDEGGCACD